MIRFRIVKYMDPVVRSLRSGHILTPPTEIQDSFLTAYYHKAQQSTITGTIHNRPTLSATAFVLSLYLDYKCSELFTVGHVYTPFQTLLT